MDLFIIAEVEEQYKVLDAQGLMNPKRKHPPRPKDRKCIVCHKPCCGRGHAPMCKDCKNRHTNKGSKCQKSRYNNSVI